MVKKQISLYGPCDITAISAFLRGRNIKVHDFNNCGTYATCLSEYWVQQINHNNNESKLIDKNSFPNLGELTKSDTIIISVLSEPLMGVYQNIYNGSSIHFGFPNKNVILNKDVYINDYKSYGDETFIDLKNNYIFKGQAEIKQILKNYYQIINFIPSSTKIIIILGPTFASAFGEENYYLKTVNVAKYYKDLNEKLTESLKCNTNVFYIDPADFYTPPKKRSELFYYNFYSITHYPTKTYFLIARQIKRIVNNRSIKIKSFHYFLKQIRHKMLVKTNDNIHKT